MSGDEVLQATVKLLRKYVPQAERGADKGLQKGIERAREWIDSAPNVGSPAFRGQLHEALDRVEVSTGAMSHLADHALTSLLERVFYGLGADEETRREFFRTELGYEETRQAMQNRTLAKLERQLAREEAWDEFVEMLEDIGQMALRAVVPILLAAI